MPTIKIMNWDWDKLQEKRRHNGNVPKGKGREEDKNTHNNPQQDEQEQYKFGKNDNSQNFEERNTRRNSYGGGKNPRQIVNNIKLPAAKWLILLAVIVWFATGIFIVKPDEAGVVLRFGAYNRTVDAGLHFHLPYPIETVTLPKVTQVRQIIVGLPQNISSSMGNRVSTANNMANDEAAMLTGDENIVNIQFSIQYYIKPDGVVDYLYKVAEPDAVVKKAAEAAMREIIGKTTLDNALTIGRSEIQDQVTNLLQSILDSYQVGIQVVTVQMQDVQPPAQVRDAFKDVASAREDKERLTNEAEAYRSDILPKAQGTATAKVNQAEAYKEIRVRNAEGEASRFLALWEEYDKAQDVTKKRLLFETLESILSSSGVDKVVIPENVSGQVLPFLPLGNQSPNIINDNITKSDNLEPLNSNTQINQDDLRPRGRGLK